MPLNPPGTAESVFATSALVIAPHFDDEVLGCGGLVAQLVAGGAAVRVLFLTDGSNLRAVGKESEESQESEGYSRRRRSEAREAVKVLGVAGFEELGLADGHLDQAVEEIARGIERSLLAQRPRLVLVTSPLEVSRDHRAAFRALHRALAQIRPGDRLEPITRDLEVLLYEVNHPQYADLLIDVTDQLPVIETAMAKYASQQERHDYLGAALGLARFRALTLGPAVRAAEAYRRLRFDDFLTSGAAALISNLGGVPALLSIDAGPKISLIVRTKDRPELLAEALASVAESTYRKVEVIVVNDGGEAVSVPDIGLPLSVVNLERNLGRSAAANAGIAAAVGEYITFLDDDDVIEADHLEILAALVGAAGVRVAYTDAAVGVYELAPGSGWRCVERRLPYSRDFDSRLLLVDNYIPFNTLLIDRQLAIRAGELDTTLELFEDWDFLIRLAELSAFHHLARVTCEYRQFRGGDHHILGSDPRCHPQFMETKTRVIAKHRHRWGDGDLAEIIDQLRAEVVAAEENDRLRGVQLRELDERYHALNGRARGYEIQQRVLEQEISRRNADLLRSEEAARERHQALGQRFAEIERLNARIEAMEQSRAWRLHQWFQGLKS